MFLHFDVKTYRLNTNPLSVGISNAIVRSIYSNRTTHWSVNDNIAKTINVIKKNTCVALTESFRDKIEKIVEKVSKKEGQII